MSFLSFSAYLSCTQATRLDFWANKWKLKECMLLCKQTMEKTPQPYVAILRPEKYGLIQLFLPLLIFKLTTSLSTWFVWANIRFFASRVWRGKPLHKVLIVALFEIHCIVSNIKEQIITPSEAHLFIFVNLIFCRPRWFMTCGEKTYFIFPRCNVKHKLCVSGQMPFHIH